MLKISCFALVIYKKKLADRRTAWENRTRDDSFVGKEVKSNPEKSSGSLNCFLFTITAEILAPPLANFYCQYADRHIFIIYKIRQQVRADNLTICYRKNKLMSVFHASFLLLIMNFFITLSEVVCGSTRLSPGRYFDNVMTKFIINNRTDP